METIEKMIEELKNNNMEIVYVPMVRVNRGNYAENLQIEDAYNMMKNKPDYFTVIRNNNQC